MTATGLSNPGELPFKPLSDEDDEGTVIEKKQR